MELGLSLGEPPARTPPCTAERRSQATGLGSRFCMDLGIGLGRHDDERSSVDPSMQLHFLPLGPVTRELGLPWMHEARNAEEPGFDVNRVPWEEEEAMPADSQNSPVGGGGDGGGSSRASDEDENSLSARKKLRLSKEQSAFLEESFKEHHTLNPKQKAALAKQLGLRPRQVEVWFQNRRARFGSLLLLNFIWSLIIGLVRSILFEGFRTKLKQTEVDCEYLKRCCETLTAENRRLQKELSDLRALKTAGPYYMQLPATTLSMCPSCERVSTAGGDRNKQGFSDLLARPRFFPFTGEAAAAPPHQPSAAS